MKRIEPICATVIEGIDKDGDGKISVKEALIAMRELWQLAGES